MIRVKLLLRVLFFIGFLLFKNPIYAVIIIDQINDISSKNKQANNVYDLNGNLCAEIRINNTIPDIVVKGNIIGTIDKTEGEILFYMAPGTKMLNINTLSDGTVEIIFSKYGIKALESGHIYNIRYHIENQIQKRIDEARIYKDAGLLGYVIDSYENVENISGDEYFLLSECAFDLAYQGNKDYTRYYEFILKAADKGNAIAQRKVAYDYKFGFGYEESQDKAIEYYSKAAKQGDEDAIIELVEYLVYDDFKIKDYILALNWVESSIQNFPNLSDATVGDILALKGLIHENMGEIKNAVEAYKSALSHETNDFLAQYRLGRFYAEGIGVDRDYEIAIKLLKEGSNYDKEASDYYINFINSTQNK